MHTYTHACMATYIRAYSQYCLKAMSQRSLHVTRIALVLTLDSSLKRIRLKF